MLNGMKSYLVSKSISVAFVAAAALTTFGVAKDGGSRRTMSPLVTNVRQCSDCARSVIV